MKVVIEKDKKLRKKVADDGYGNARHCRICNKPISRNDIDNNNFEYVKNKFSENFFHSSCVKEEMKNVRKRNRTKIS